MPNENLLRDDTDTPEENYPEKFISDRQNAELHFRKKIPVGVLGATGSVGQRFIELLSQHPWFEITALAASEKSVGKKYKEATNWVLPSLLPEKIGEQTVRACTPNLPCKIVFSALDSSVAGTIETEFAAHGYVVVSNAKNHRMDPKVPLIIPEVNEDHLALVKSQNFPNNGMIVTNPNCSVIGLTLALRPLQLEFGIESCRVVTMQASSGAGIPGVPSLFLLDNIIPYIEGEEEKIQTEPCKILGTLQNSHIVDYPISISANCNRVPVTEGHLEVVSITLKQKATMDEVKRAWREFQPPMQNLKLPSACKSVLYYFEEQNFPQTRLHRNLDNGMAISIGRLRKDPLADYSFVVLSHNTIRGAAGGAILIGELLVKRGYVFW